MVNEIYIIDCESDLSKKLRQKFKKEKMFTFKNISPLKLEIALKNIPDLIIINEVSIGDIDIIDLCKHIREDEDNSITPVLVLTKNDDEIHKISIIKNDIEYIVSMYNYEYLYYVIKNIIRLLSVNRMVSPLTGLPGNVQIQTELKKRLLKKETFQVLYLDLDNFKAYNDKYGFLKGDEIIKLTARVIARNIHIYEEEKPDAFIGHIGGDDFIVIIGESMDYDKICQNIIAEFNQEILKFFNDEDLARGYMEICNRKGVIEEFPLTSISIGVVIADKKRFSNILEIGEVGAQVKHLAKAIMGSAYAIDRRE